MNKFIMAFKLFPTVLAGVAAVNDVLHGLPGQGKADVLLAGAAAAAKVAAQAPESHVQAVGLMVGDIVQALNDTGFFAHAGKPSVVASTLVEKQETTPILDAQIKVRA